MSPPAICISFPILSIKPAAGITAITVISTFPNFCRKSKLISFFFGAGWAGAPLPDVPLALFPAAKADVPLALLLAAEPAVPLTAPFSASEPSAPAAERKSTASLPASTLPAAASICSSSTPSHRSTGVTRFKPLFLINSKSASATKSPIFTLSPSCLCTVNPSPCRPTVSKPTCTNTSTPSSD